MAYKASKGLAVLAITIAALTVHHARAVEPSFEVVARCVFIYGGIFEAGRDLNHADVFQFGQARLGWVGGFFSSQQIQSSFRSDLRRQP
jgi:hypothetical protein